MNQQAVDKAVDDTIAVSTELHYIVSGPDADSSTKCVVSAALEVPQRQVLYEATWNATHDVALDILHALRGIW